jgi:hypothetical protein
MIYNRMAGNKVKNKKPIEGRGPAIVILPVRLNPKGLNRSNMIFKRFRPRQSGVALPLTAP